MKRFIYYVSIVAAICVAAGAVVYAATVTEQQLRERPRTVMNNARAALDAALKSGDSQALIEALVQEAVAQIAIDADSVQSVAERVEQVIQLCDNEVDKSVLNVFLADIYMQYYAENSYLIRKRSYIAGNEEIATWNIRNFSEMTDSLCRRALMPKQQLQSTPISQYKTVMQVADGGLPKEKALEYVRMFTPTMYDFVARQAIRLYQHIDMEAIRSRNVMCNACFAPANSFVADTIPIGIGDERIWQIYRSLLTFHAARPESASYFMWNLNRLDYAHSLLHDSRDDYSKALMRLIDDFRSHDFVVEAVIDWAGMQRGSNEFETLKNAYNVAQEWIARYPNYYRTNCLRDFCKDLSSAYIRASVPQVVYPGTPVVAEIKYKNAREATYSLIKCAGILPTENLYSLGVQRAQGRVVAQGKLSLSDTLTFVTNQTQIDLPKLDVGCYALKIQPSGAKPQATFFVVTRYMTLVLSELSGEALIMSVDSKSGKPAVGVPVTVYSHNRVRLRSLRTDSLGLCRMKVSASRGYEVATQVGSDVFSPMVGVYRGYVRGASNDMHMSLFTDRSVYRPGQKLYFSGLVYQLKEDVRRIVSGEDVVLRLFGANGEELWRDTLNTDEYGSVHGEILLPDDVLTGGWSLSARGKFNEARKWIEVSEYKRPQFRVECNPVDGSFSFGDSISVTGNAKTYSGVPVAHAAVSYSVLSSPLYYYGWHSEEEIASGSVETDADGRFRLSFLAALPAENVFWKKYGTRFTVKATVTSTMGESQTGETIVRVSDVSLYVRIDIPEMLRRDTAGTIAVTVKNNDDNVVAVPVEIELYKLSGDSIGQPLDEMNVAAEPVWSSSLPAGKTELTPPWHTLQSGAYRWVARTTDEQERTVTDMKNFILYGNDDVRPPVAVPLWLPETKLTVLPGDVAKFEVGSSYRDASLLYLLFDGDKQIDCRRIALDNSVMTIEVPYRQEYGKLLQVALVLVRDGKVYTGMENGSNGTFVIQRQETDYRLVITPETFRDKTQPGNRETWRFTVRDVDGKPVDALFMAEMYDASLDALRSHEWNFAPVYKMPLAHVSWNKSWLWQQTADCYVGYNPVSANYKCYYVPDIELNEYGLSHYSLSHVVIRGYSSGKAMQKLRNASVDCVEEECEVMECADAVVTEDVAENKMDFAAAVAGEGAPAAGQPTEADALAYRKNLVETAFFYPHLVTDESGRVKIEFTVPDVNTTWNFYSLAVTRSLLNGHFNASVVSSKPLMVSPNMPRFVRQGDTLSLAVAVQNTTDSMLRGETRMALYLPDTDREIAVLTEPFVAGADSTVTVQFTVEIPDTLSLVGVRVGASTATFADGEQQLLAVLPATTMVTEAKPFYIAPSVADTTVTFESMMRQMDRSSLRNYRVTLEYCDNPLWYAVTALPALAEPSDNSSIVVMASLYANTVARGIVAQNPVIAEVLENWRNTMKSGDGKTALTSQLENNPELKQLLLQQTPWVLDAADDTERMRQIATLLDGERAAALCSDAVGKLQKMQHADGGWAWFEPMQSSFFVTLNVVEGLSRLSAWGETPNDERIALMKLHALSYLDKEFLRMNRHDSSSVGYDDLCYLYVRSRFTDIPLTGSVLLLHKRKLELIAKNWNSYDDIQKAYAAVALHRYGYRNTARNIVASLREYAITTSAQGMYWPNNRSLYFYRNSAVQTHCAIYEAFLTIDPKLRELDAMRQWLLMQKQTQAWGNVPSTLDAVAVLLTSGSDWLSEGQNTRLAWGDVRLPEPSQTEQTFGYEKYARSGEAIVKSDAVVTLKNHAGHPSWGAIYWQYYDKMSAVEAHGSEQIRVSRDYYVIREGQLVPVEQTVLHVGDKVTVRLVLYIDRDMQFMTLTDTRPACFEPVEQLPVYDCGEAVCYYREPKDAVTSFYFDYLPKGTRVIEYEVYVDRAGHYQAGIANFQSYYAPQYTAHSAGDAFVVE